VDLAEQQGQILMPAYTHLQRAQPIALGGELMAWAETLDRAKRRLDTLLEGVVMENPLGSGAVAGSSLPLDRLATAEALGVGPPTANAIDATSSRDAAIDFVYGLSMLMMSLSRWAEQWILYASTEFGFLKLDGRYTTGSSMMPQKQNPDMLELIRGRCGNVYGQLMSLLTMCKGLPLGYNRDLQEDKRLLFAAYDTAMGCLQMARRIIQTAHFDQERIEAGLDRGFLDATSLAEYLVQQGVPFRTAHQWVGQAVRLCQERGLSRLNDLSLAQLQSAAQASGLNPDCVGASVYDWLGAANVVRRYRSPGNAGLGGLQEQLEAWRTRLGRR
jgi:argininosuccinate lyase